MEKLNQYNQLFLHIPHSSATFPQEMDDVILSDEQRLLIDYYTDELFIPSRKTQLPITAEVFPLCRLFCDVERLPHDPLEAKNLGICSIGNQHQSHKEYLAFQHKVENDLLEAYYKGEKILLIDCHSFSAQETKLVPYISEIDICIGFNEDESKPSDTTIEYIEGYFKSKGYKVGINTPFSNSKTFGAPVPYHSLMIEVNKRLYMDEVSGQKTDGFRRLQMDISELYDEIRESL